jgi:hypothetical protein
VVEQRCLRFVDIADYHRQHTLRCRTIG